MQIKEYFTLDEDEKQMYFAQIKQSDWGAGKYLYELLKSESLKKLCGEKAKVLLLTEKEKLISFCTFAEKDDIPPPELTTWGLAWAFSYSNYANKILLTQKENTGKCL